MRAGASTMRRASIAVGVVVVVVLIVSARLFVWSPIDRPTRVDAIVALGGDPGQRRAHEAVALARRGFAPVAVISLGGYPPAPCPEPVPGVEVLCFRASPLDTRGEAEYVGALAARRHWHRLIVVSERTQTTRARLLFKRCTSARLVMVPVSDPVSHLPFDVLYEWGALAKALVLHRSC